MYTLALKNYPIPGDPAFPLNALYAKPQKGTEEGKLIYGWVHISVAYSSSRLRAAAQYLLSGK